LNAVDIEATIIGAFDTPPTGYFLFCEKNAALRHLWRVFDYACEI